MLDAKFIAENADLVRTAVRNKPGDPKMVDGLLDHHKIRKAAQQKLDEANHESKKISEQYRQGGNKEELGRKGAALKDEIRKLESTLRDLDRELTAKLLVIPNVPHESVPVGADAAGNKVEKSWGTRKTFTFKPKPHWEVAARLGILDEERSAKISGSGFILLKGAGARLERALINFFLDVHTTEHGYTEIWPPALVNRDAMTGTGQLPKFEDQMYRLGAEDEGLFLIPTAEVPVTNIHRKEILQAAHLPIRYTAYPPCFRRESGAAGKDTRGMVRVHQFDKVELVQFTHPDRSWEAHEALTRHAETILERLGLEYHRLLLCTGDMSFASAKTYDLEAWAPGVDRWLEVSSCSNFTDFQARRMECRFRDQDGKVKFVHTLNGSGLALPRVVVAILENGQREDGSVELPKALQPYMAGRTELR